MKSSLIKSITLAGLVGLFSRETAANDKFSIYGGFGGYIPSNSETTLGGMPYGFGCGLDFGNKYIGFRGGFDIYGKVGNQSGEIDYSGRIREGQRERVLLTRVSGGLRFGNPVLHIGVGGCALEAQNIFERTDRKFLSQEVEQFKDSGLFYGPYGEVVVGGQLKEKCRVFLSGGVDYLFSKDNNKPVFGIKVNAGVNFSP